MNYCGGRQPGTLGMQYPMFSVPDSTCSIIWAFLTYTCSVMSIWCFNKAYWSEAAFLESFLSIILRTFGPSPWAYSVGTPQGTPVPTTCLSSVDMPGRGARRAVPGHFRQWWVQSSGPVSLGGCPTVWEELLQFLEYTEHLKVILVCVAQWVKSSSFARWEGRFWRSVSQYCEYT